MLYMKEQRPIYAAVMKLTGTAGVNKILGDKVSAQHHIISGKRFTFALWDSVGAVINVDLCAMDGISGYR